MVGNNSYSCGIGALGSGLHPLPVGCPGIPFDGRHLQCFELCSAVFQSLSRSDSLMILLYVQVFIMVHIIIHLRGT